MKPRRTECFKCHIGGIRLGFARGKDEFHGPTIRERQRHHEAEMTSAGVKWEPVGKRWV